MNRRDLIALLGSTAATWPLGARAQYAGIVHRIGFLGSATAAGSAKAVEVTPNGAPRPCPLWVLRRGRGPLLGPLAKKTKTRFVSNFAQTCSNMRKHRVLKGEMD